MTAWVVAFVLVVAVVLVSVYVLSTTPATTATPMQSPDGSSRTIDTGSTVIASSSTPPVVAVNTGGGGGGNTTSSSGLIDGLKYIVQTGPLSVSDASFNTGSGPTTTVNAFNEWTWSNNRFLNDDGDCLALDSSFTWSSPSDNCNITLTALPEFRSYLIQFDNRAEYLRIGLWNLRTMNFPYPSNINPSTTSRTADYVTPWRFRLPIGIRTDLDIANQIRASYYDPYTNDMIDTPPTSTWTWYSIAGDVGRIVDTTTSGEGLMCIRGWPFEMPWDSKLLVNVALASEGGAGIVWQRIYDAVSDTYSFQWIDEELYDENGGLSTTPQGDPLYLSLTGYKTTAECILEAGLFASVQYYGMSTGLWLER